MSLLQSSTLFFSKINSFNYLFKISIDEQIVSIELKNADTKQVFSQSLTFPTLSQSCVFYATISLSVRNFVHLNRIKVYSIWETSIECIETNLNGPLFLHINFQNSHLKTFRLILNEDSPKITKSHSEAICKNKKLLLEQRNRSLIIDHSPEIKLPLEPGEELSISNSQFLFAEIRSDMLICINQSLDVKNKQSAECLFFHINPNLASTPIRSFPVGFIDSPVTIWGPFLLVTDENRNSVRIYNLDTSKLVYTIPCQHKLFSLSVETSGRLIGFGFANGKIQVVSGFDQVSNSIAGIQTNSHDKFIFNRNSFRRICPEWTPTSGPVFSILFDYEKDRVFSGHGSGLISCYHLKRKRYQFRKRIHQSFVFHLSLFSDMLYSSSRDGKVVAVHSSNLQTQQEFNLTFYSVYHFQIIDGKFLAFGCNDEIAIFNLLNGRKVQKLTLKNDDIQRVVYSDGKVYCISSESIHVLNHKSQTRLSS